MHKDSFLNLIEIIKKANSFVLSTHRKSDGDGIGSEIAMAHALTKMGKRARVINVDAIPEKYNFLANKLLVESYENGISPIEKTDVTLIFDTNDKRLIEPLYSELEKKSNSICFIDHHPTLQKGPLPTETSWLNIDSASTGEMAYKIISELKIELDPNIAEALYTSIVFDTQLFRYIRRSGTSHEIAAKLLKENFDSLSVHRTLFGNYSATKLKFVAQSVSRVEFLAEDKIAIAIISKKDLEEFNLIAEDTRDIIDMIMNINTLEIAVLIREEGPEDYKVSFRSRGKYKVNQLAESLGGGGHAFASGATLLDNIKNIRKDLYANILDLVKN